MSFKPLNKSISPLVKSIQQVQTTVVKSITQKNHTLKGDLIAIIIIILTIFLLQQLYYYIKKNEGMTLMDKSEKQYIENECSKINKQKVCNALTKRGLKKCSKYPCCAWVKYEKGARCVRGDDSGPYIQSSVDKFDEYYYLGKKYNK